MIDDVLRAGNGVRRIVGIAIDARQKGVHGVIVEAILPLASFQTQRFLGREQFFGFF